ncbi:MAG: FAD-dependent oxidoreductase [Actinomycetota bacterium]|nr:FAD-dependent oxidoreductase [Actinomycetota bacterium]
MAPDLDVLVVGSGVAGLSLAVRLADSSLRVGVLTKAELSQSTTRWAQGGVAAVLGGDEDSVDLHHADTLAAGAGLCDVEAVRVLVAEGPDRVHELIALGAVFDSEAGGSLALAREGGHSTARIVHAGGAATGAEVERALVEALHRGAAAVLEHWFAVDLVLDAGRCTGVVARDPQGNVRQVAARHVVVATGGVGQLYAVTTNPAEATGDGVAMALRSRVPVADVEFVQFHPTALHHPAMPRPLLSEALRGHGALLRDASGDRFVDELAPRDVVSRAMADRMADQGVDHLWLDATALEGFDDRFPTLAASVRAAGLDPATDWFPIAPAAHHVSGGICTDLDGASALPGLWAVGEAACTGVHGANRLASNSLLEGMVFGARAAEAIAAGREGPVPTGALAAILLGEGSTAGEGRTAGEGSTGRTAGRVPVVGVDGVILPDWAAGADPASAPPARGSDPEPDEPADWEKWRDRVQRAMTDGAGVVRSPASLRRAATTLGAAARALDASAGASASAGGDPSVTRAAAEVRNLVTVGWALLRAAVAREETRGAHTRRDHPGPEERWRLRLAHGALSGGAVPASSFVPASGSTSPVEGKVGR